MKKQIVHLGVVGVDSGQLMICDPCYIKSEFIERENDPSDFAHSVYRHKDGSLWQYGLRQSVQGTKVNMFRRYDDKIEQYDMSPYEMITQGLMVKTDLDPTPHIPDGEFSYQGICKKTLSEDQGGQLNFRLGHPGVAVAFSSGLGDGVYDVYAEIEEGRVRKVWIEF